MPPDPDDDDRPDLESQALHDRLAEAGLPRPVEPWELTDEELAPRARPVPGAPGLVNVTMRPAPTVTHARPDAFIECDDRGRPIRP